jgi:hypothetical protein
MEKRKRRRFTAGYKVEALKRLEESGEPSDLVPGRRRRGERHLRLAAPPGRRRG